MIKLSLLVLLTFILRLTHPVKAFFNATIEPTLGLCLYVIKDSSLSSMPLSNPALISLS